MQTNKPLNVDDLPIIIRFYQQQNNIQKSKVYIKNPQEAPQGAKVQHGKKGGLYYESDSIETNNESDKLTLSRSGNNISLDLGELLVPGERIPKGHIGKIDIEVLPDENGFVELKGIRVEQEYRGKGLGEYLLLNLLKKLQNTNIKGIKSIKYSSYENEEGRSDNATRMFERILNDKNNPIKIDKVNNDDYYITLKEKIGKAYRVTYRSKGGNEDFVGAKDKNEADEKVKEIEDSGHKIINVELLKAKVYVKNPQDDPKDVLSEK